MVTRDPDEFKASPIGRCIVGASYVIWCHSADLQGSILWGALDERTVREMMAIGEFLHHPSIAPRRRALTDCSGVDRTSADVLTAFVGHARAYVAGWSSQLERQALIVPPGLGGLLIAGALPTAGSDHPLRICQALEPALAHLDHPAARAAHAAALEVAAGVRGVAELVLRLRAYLEREPDCATIEGAARALGLSTRTLQRQLHALATSFSDELRCVRIAAAEQLLVHTDLKIEAIATQVGFGTASRMSAFLRRELKVTAGELRRQRGARTSPDGARTSSNERDMRRAGALVTA